ncbi:efflux RND transporter periplasmic adaptor subunit [Thioalkalivibrio sulfidiphilus]|uniref:Efflux transporter, RND family, MFP subunit n=1 Tax=Thioalkalivibrio sulfidiphilus (strain HL-EbGR7) TaxID=396588 RepID=B8GRK7_THISH|nr:HlyD family efflux transporter periplasmic adaptor subunit [Thioalkalivibrio sulfidiphilus]ACL72561.1 efflux transporter, RND family, MFP subunit [Thioalkalivibrio sulfidiphilus HL-EbGr7]
MIKKILIVVVALIVAGLIALGFRPTPVLVDVETVTPGHLAITVEEEGRTRVIDRYEVSAPLTAQARRIHLQVGDAVRLDDVLVTLDAPASPALDARTLQEARARLAAAEAALETARAEVRALAAQALFAREEFERLKGLAEQQLISRSALDRAATELDQAEALTRSARFRVQTAIAQRDAAQAVLAHSNGQDPDAFAVLELRSPVNGLVLRRHFESARVVQPGEPILEIGDPGRLEVAVDVLSADAVRIEPGMRVIFERWGETRALEGRVRRVEPTGFTKISALGVEEQRVWVIADITSAHEDWARLGDGYRVNARFVLWESDDVLRVPTSALFRHQGDWAVFVLEDGRARLRTVGIGRRGAIHSEAGAGLEAGERVVVHPDRDISDGVRLRLRAE